MEQQRSSVFSLILVPAIITLAVTILRAVGELQQWSETFFSRSAGGGGAIVGIVWLAFIFAIYFAVKLTSRGEVFQSTGKAIGINILALVLLVGGSYLMVGGGDFKFSPMMAAGLLVLVISLIVMRFAWPAYWNVMLAYALAARIPVIVVYFLAIRGNWGTHYDALPQGTTDATFGGWMPKFMILGLVPQLLFWIPVTVVVCGLLGVITAAVRKRGVAPAQGGGE